MAAFGRKELDRRGQVFNNQVFKNSAIQLK
jgi:hypothetical protein